MADQGGIICPNGHEIPAHAGAGKFCRVCGSSLLKQCPAGHLSPAEGPFCGTCGVAMENSPSTPNNVAAPTTPVTAATAATAATTVTPVVAAATVPSAQPSEAALPPRERMSETQPVPTVGVAGAGDAAGRRSEPGRTGGPWLIVAIVAIIVVLGLAGGLVYILHKNNSPSKSADGSVTTVTSHTTSKRFATTTTSTTNATTTSVASEAQAAQTLAALLVQSVSDRSSINAASDDVSTCGPNLSQDQQIFATAAGSRQSLISQVSSNPSLSALPALMIESLTGAWQASEQVDQDYANWANDEVSNGCTPNDTADSNYQAALGPNQTATQDKMAFASAWDSIATTYNLPTYQWNQL